MNSSSLKRKHEDDDDDDDISIASRTPSPPPMPWTHAASHEVITRRGLDSERQTKETEEQRRMREDDAARRSAIASEVSDILKAFYCSLCDKQFKNVAQYDEHTNSNSSFGTAPTPAPTEPILRSQASRLGWQQFQKSNSRRY
ncbi:hypothetical protein BDZ89DRAFT_1075015 [Hymenopellis radicata]|nr:hypothetical protein BDZ89DRAFT_1075015 [Hymenopellis radicata]